jgi:Fe-S-cluster containining protein
LNGPQELVRCDTYLDFSCRGCGSRCCGNRNIQLTTIDFWRMAWHTTRLNVKPAGVYMLVDEQTGLPSVQMAANPCPFLMEVNQVDEQGYAQPAGQEWCGIWKERPNACRTYPVATEIQLHKNMDVLVARHIEKCPGYGKTGPGAPKRTVYQYAREQIGEERWIELFLYAAGVIHVLRTQGLYWQGAGGRLTEDQVLKMGVGFLYRKAPMSPEPKMDHDLVLALMAEQVKFLKKGGLSVL